MSRTTKTLSATESKGLDGPLTRRELTSWYPPLSCAAVLALLTLGCSSLDQYTCPSAGPVQCPQFFPHQLHQATCSVSRTECSGWTFDQTSVVDEVNCFTPNFATTPFTATACFDSGTTTAATACNQYCANATTYLFSPLRGNGVVTCTSQVTQDSVVPDGQCGTAPGADTGRTTAVSCTLGGRLCASPTTSPDGTEVICGSMPTHTFSISPTSIALRGCFDSHALSAQTFCENMYEWPDNPVPNSISPTEFPWVNVSSILPNAAACSTTSSTGAITFGIANGTSLGSIQGQGVATNLTAKGGSFATTRSCDPDGEFCTTSLSALTLVLNDVTVGGITIGSPQIDLVSPVNLGLSGATIQPNSMTLQIGGDIPGFRREITNVSPPTPLSVTTTATTMAMAGTFPITINGLTATVVTANINITISGSTSNGSNCTGQTPQQALLGFESTQYWTSTQAPLTLDGVHHTQGCFGLDVGGSGYRTINSTQIQTPIAGTTSVLALDVFVPPNQPNPSFLGAIQMYLSCPSANAFNMYIGQAELTGKPVGQFSSLTFPISSPIRQVLNGSHPDCTFGIAVNTNQTPTPPVVDNLRFQ